MSTEWRASGCDHASIFELSDLDSSDGCALPEPVFLRFTASKEETREYRAALSVADIPPPDFWVPRRGTLPRSNECPSASNARSLRKFQNSRLIPDSVQFCLPEWGQDAETPTSGYFTCYEAFLLNCQLWFPIPRVIVELLDLFKLPISQLCPSSLQHLVGLLVLGYERGMSLSTDYLEAMLLPKRARGGCFYLSPRLNMSVNDGLASNGHEWKGWFFYVRIDGASVEESCIPLFRTERATKASNPPVPLLGDLTLVRSLRRGSPLYWEHFSPKRVHRAVAYYSSDINVEDYINFSVPSSEVDPEETPTEMPAETPFAKASRLLNKVRSVSASDAEIRKAESRAKVAETEAARLKEEIDANFSRAQEWAESEIARVREEYEADSRRVIELSDTRVRRSRRAGKREVAAEMMVRREQFAPQNIEVKDAQRANGDYRECRGVVGGLHFTQDVNY
ncbi:PREDICTED: uncharacterized protein LOC106339173 [Brassica oleracea var. oleracea]|uniref:uncharacterized protein LOC106339173 n=1 Tax=Brassica oleracea var. oleracea TaxID=109376 RepID=UPI0006A6D6D2|nr:PREDICTED: uncharacterized protein LOC106339173 [Brassica oleracea var. oleracea]